MEVYESACLEKWYSFSYICVMKSGESLWGLAVPAGVNSQHSCFLCANGSKSWLAWGIWVLIPLCPHWEQHWCQNLRDNDTQIQEQTSDIESACRDKAWINAVYTITGTVNLSFPPPVSCFLSDLCAFRYLCKNFSSAACVDSGQIALSQNHRIS